MHLHFLGICGTFMGSLALLAREMGHEVSGCDLNVYPPMNTQLEEQGIKIHQGYDIAQFDVPPDLVIIGNALSRGNEAVEYVLNQQLNYCSGPQWLSENLLNKKWVLAVSGTHGKTTTTSMLVWILEQAGYKPGFLIGGVPANMDCSARLGDSDFFVIEADEYDTAFFDKRSKFVHYHPRTLIMNNLEYDHADIFPNIEAIQTQFHHLLRLVPSQGLVIYPENEKYLQAVVDQGVWSDLAILACESEKSAWSFRKINEDGSEFEISNNAREESVTIKWGLIGDHNIQNAFAACVAAFNVGVPLAESASALSSFENVRRRFEKIADMKTQKGISLSVYDDFAHHPTAIKTTLLAVREKVAGDKVIAILEPRSNSMKMGVHGESMASACEQANEAFWYVPNSEELTNILSSGNNKIFHDLKKMQKALIELAFTTEINCHFVIMSNGGFSGFQKSFVEALKETLESNNH
jgi:UDP-N-acetylmuramate: L-alanyl-gamma-D-glutamyl-meso-diaminopimelate ligase